MKTAELNAIAQSWGYSAKGASLTGQSNALGILGSANSDVALGNAFAAGLEGSRQSGRAIGNPLEQV